MSFLQPWMLFALPLVALPIIIHLVNQRRFRTMEWGAMIFLLAANKMSRGFARLRRWLIMAARTLVLAGLIFGVARPLASGWLGLAAGNRTDTTIVLLDRSPSMSAMDKNNVATKLATGRQQLAEALEKLRSNHWVLIDSATGEAQELDSAANLLAAANAEQASASADLPTMLQAAHQYAQANQTGRTDIWICSDLRQNDWDADGGRWTAVRDSFSQLPQAVRFYLLAYPEIPSGNRSIRVTSVKRQPSPDGAELLVSLEIKRGGKIKDETIPIEFTIDGARSVLNVDINGPTFELADHALRLADDQVQGWGKVAIPADAVAPDNEFYFVFDRQPTLRTLVVIDDDSADVRALQLSAEIPSERTSEASVELVTSSQLESVAWDEIGLVLWQARLPSATDAILLKTFVDGDGRIVFLPPRNPGSTSCFGLTWQAWQPTAKEVTIGNWRGDADLLANTQSGTALPVGELKIKRTCGLAGEVVPLASLSDGQPVLVRAPTDRGGVYALTTTTAEGDSTLASNGIVLYVLVQRALQGGSTRLAGVRQAVAGSKSYESANSAAWQRLAGADQALSNQLQLHSGVFQDGEKLLAFNRRAAEDEEHVLAGEEVDRLFGELPFVRVEERGGAKSSLIREIWRLFIIAMLLAMVAEAALCLPRKPVSDGALP